MYPKKRYGQHFLLPQWADKVVAAIGPRPEDRFLEIGSGPGVLTQRLAPRVAHLTAVEVDQEMVDLLTPDLPANVTLVHRDFLDTPVGWLADGADGSDGPLRVAGNLPYNVSSPIMFRLIETHKRHGGLTDATLMLQREVAERIEAKPGSKDYGVLSISVQLHADVRRVLSLPPGAFRPAPKVHSSVIQLRFRPPAVALSDEAGFEAMVRSMFTQRRKTLSNALKPFASSRGHQSAAALASAGIDPSRRPETLQLDELARLADFFSGPKGA